NSSAVFLERAFANYAFTKSFIFSAGRLPTVDGMPKHMSRDQAMMGNYPTLAYSAIFDGVAFTYLKSIGAHKFTGRFVYTPFSQLNLNNRSKRVVDSSNQKVDSLEDGYSLMFEYENEQLSWARRAHIILQYLVNDNFYLPLSTNNNLYAYLSRYVIASQFDDVASTGFDFGLSFVHNRLRSRGAIPGVGGWMTASGVNGQNNGNAYLATVKY